MDHIEVIRDGTTDSVGKIVSGTSTSTNPSYQPSAILSERTPLRSGSNSAIPIQYQTMYILSCRNFDSPGL